MEDKPHNGESLVFKLDDVSRHTNLISITNFEITLYCTVIFGN